MNGNLKRLLDSYDTTQIENKINALRETIQIIALCGLNKSGFFDNALFYGGTALRIFYGLDRFSEDLDFSLVRGSKSFDLTHHLNAVTEELHKYGLVFETLEKDKTHKSSVLKANIKGNQRNNLESAGLLNSFPANIDPGKKLNIRIEVDSNPPGSFKTEELMLPPPFSEKIRTAVKGYLFADKIHALLFRHWKNHVKGRDWYDFEWYIKKGIAAEKKHLIARIKQSEVESLGDITVKELQDMIYKKIHALDFESAKKDITPFTRDTSGIDKWNEQYFIALLKKLKLK